MNLPKKKKKKSSHIPCLSMIIMVQFICSSKWPYDLINNITVASGLFKLMFSCVVNEEVTFDYTEARRSY